MIVTTEKVPDAVAKQGISQDQWAVFSKYLMSAAPIGTETPSAPSNEVPATPRPTATPAPNLGGARSTPRRRTLLSSNQGLLY